jgi:hypothetical protein
MLEIEWLLAANSAWNFHKYVSLLLYHIPSNNHHRAHRLLKKYRTNSYITLLVTIFQLFMLLKIIAQTEIAPCDRRWANIPHQAVNWKGVLVPRHFLC